LNRQFPPILNLRIGGDRAVPAVALAALRARLAKSRKCQKTLIAELDREPRSTIPQFRLQKNRRATKTIPLDTVRRTVVKRKGEWHARHRLAFGRGL
jgi:hypothetical protein